MTIRKSKTRKKSKRPTWSKEDVGKLKTLAKAKTPAKKIAAMFKKSIPAIRQKALRLGLSLDTRSGRAAVRRRR